MIYTNSRYYSGPLSQIENTISVGRKFPESQTLRVFSYTWKQNDRLDQIAAFFLKDPEAWWKILDLNPQLKDCTNIAVGTTIRVPYE